MQIQLPPSDLYGRQWQLEKESCSMYDQLPSPPPGEGIRHRRTRRQPDEAAHALPGWVNFIQDNLFLSFLILAEAYLLGTLMTLGWVPDIESPSHWGTYHGVGVVLFFLAGAMAAGVALRCSVAAAAGFRRREWGFALFNFLGVAAFCGAEIWASLSERSANLHPTPADKAVLQLLGVSALPVSPTVVVVALLLPFASLYYGFSQQRQHHDSPEERAAKLAEEEAALERKLLRARMQAQIRSAQAAGLAGALRAGVQAARGAGAESEASDRAFEHDLAAPAGQNGRTNTGAHAADPFA
jgi:hypothetical protein